MFDASRPATLPSLEKWWDEFRTHAPVRDGDVEEFCTVIVGNKMDMLERRLHSESENVVDGLPTSPSGTYVSEADAQALINKIVPPSSRPPTPTDLQHCPSRSDAPGTHTPSSRTLHRSHPSFNSSLPPSPGLPSFQQSTRSIAILPNAKAPGKARGASNSRSRSRSRSQHFAAGTVGTLGTMTTTTLSIYHTPSSSLFDDYASARSASLASASRFTHASASSSDPSRNASPVPSGAGSADGRGVRRMASLTLSTTSDVPTVTPRALARSRSPAASLSLSPPQPPGSPVRGSGVPPLPPRPERGARLFFTSAKTGAGVADVFAHIAARVLRKWEFEEASEARRMSIWDAVPAAGEGAIRLEDERGGIGRWRGHGRCCAS